MNKRIISFILAFIMIFGTGIDALAVVEPTAPSTPVSGELVELGEKDGKVILGTKPRRFIKESFNSANSDGLEFGDERVGTPVRGTGTQMDQKVIVNLKRIGLNGLDTDTSNDKTFDDTAVNYPLAIDVYFQDAPAKGTVTFGNTDTRQEITIQIPSSGYQNLDDFYLMVPKADAVDGADYAIRADYSHGTPTAGKDNKAITINLELIELPETKMSVKYQDPYGNELTTGLPSSSPVAKLHLAKDYSFDLGTTSKDKTRNEFYKIIEGLADNSRSQINSIGNDPKISIDSEGTDGKLQIGTDEFKVIKKEYTTSKGGDIVIQSQPKVLVPTPGADGTLPAKPAGYARLTFKADESATDGVKGTFDQNNQKDKQRVVDVKVGTSYTDKEVKDAIAGLNNPQAIDTKANKIDDKKVFEKWNPETSKLTGKAAETDNHVFNAVYTGRYTSDEIIPFLPDETVPKTGSDGKEIPSNYINATFQAEKDGETALGTVTVGTKTGEVVVAKVKPNTDLSKHFKTKTQPTITEPEIKVTPNANYGFTKWNPQLGTVQSVNPYVAKFVKDGQEIGETDPVPEGWHKVTVKQDNTIQAGTVPTKYYAVAPKNYNNDSTFTGKLTTDGAFPGLANTEKQGYKDPAWYVDGTKVDNPAEKEITGNITFIAKAVVKTTVEGTPTEVNPTADAQETGLIVKNQDATTPTTVTAVDEDGTTVTATIDPATGKIKVTPGTNVDGPITLTVKDDDFKDATNTTGEKTFIIPVKGHAAGRDDNRNGYPSTPSYDYLTLTLDENYRNGDISHYDVYVGDLIERYLYTPHRRGYVFEGWSYNSRRLDEVRYGERIYRSTTLYAIWSKQKAKDDEEVEPIDTREVGTHNAYMFGYTDGTIRPNGKITRAEAAALVTRLLDIEAYASDVKPNFPDTPSGWYNKAINAAVARGIMKGYPDGTFRPNAPITRAEFTQMISTIDNKPYGVAPFADVIGHWAERAIGAEYQAGRINGYPDGTFRPDAHITRAEAVVILNKIFDRNYDAASALQTPTKANIKMFSDLFTSFWGYNDMVEATNTHSFKRRVKGSVQEDWVEVK